MLLPGAGHVILRDWLRALLFAGLYFVTFYLFFPIERLAAAGSFSEMMEISTEVDTLSHVTVLFVTLLAAFDATFRALGFPPDSTQSGDGPTCPECGKELDEDLEFCHWCTTRLEPTPETEPEDDPARS